MDISDDGPDLATTWQESDNNLCGVVRGRLAASTVAELLVRASWKSRSSSWDGYEVETIWCQAEVDPVQGTGILLNGVIDPDKLDVLATLLARLGTSFSLELYDGNGALVREITT
ncbi:hypothetical protein ACGF5F_31235 [Streptomyces sp. NPDC047821]|uniref:hypothetical protein n=1 Tax=Streptomyces sp. NPDC047821 TaxID=3365488 RepID=UPI003714BA7F